MTRPSFFIGRVVAAFMLASICPGARAANVASPGQPTDAKPVVSGPEGQRAFDDLGKCYAANYGWPDYKPSLADLGSPDAPTAQRAGNYILALFEQSFADESNGRAGWNPTLFVNAGPDNRAHDFRQAAAKDFGLSGSSEAALPAALWLIENDPIADDTEAGVHVLARVHSDAADKALGQLINEVHPNQEVLVTAVTEAGTRHLAQFKDGVISLEQSYRKAVREAAVRAAAQLGETKPVPYDPFKAFSPRVLDLLKVTLERIQTPVPANGRWLDGIAQPYWHPGKPYPVHGWLLSRDDKGVTYLDIFGRIQSASPDRVQFTVGSFEKTAESYAEMRSTVQSESAQMAAIEASPDFQNVNSPKWKDMQTRHQRLWADTEDRLKEMTTLMRFIGPAGNKFLNLPEMTVAAWCWQRGDLASAAAILFPCYDAARDDRWLDWSSRDDIGNIYNLDLLQKFTVDRNYPAALALATHMGKPVFEGYVYHARAKELAAQLAVRSEDFTTLTLPSPAEWAKIELTLDRTHQIRWLATRLKLMHCINPDYDEVQFASAYPDDHAPQDAPEVINPYSELIALNLEPADLLTLAPFAGDQDYSLGYTFYKDWIPERGLCRVSWAVGALINHVAGFALVHDTENGISFQHSQESDIVADLQSWVAAHYDDTPDKLIAETLRTSHDWNILRGAAIHALEIHHVEVLSMLADRLESVSKDEPGAGATEADFVHLFYSSHAHMVDEARKWVKSPYPEVRLWASLILMRDGDVAHDEGLATLEPLLSGREALDRYMEAAPALLASPSPRARRLAAGLFPRIDVHKDDANGIFMDWMFRRYFLAGRQECLDFLLLALDDYTIDPNIHDVAGNPHYSSDGVVQGIGMWSLRHIRRQPATEPEIRQYRASMKAWLTAQFALVQRGKTLAIDVPPPDQYEQYLTPPSRPVYRSTAEAAANTQD